LKEPEKLNRKEFQRDQFEKPANRLHLRQDRVHPVIRIFIRAVLGVAIAILITRMFRGSVSPEYVAGLAIVLVGLAYVLEYFRKRKDR
jgi:hypothetical protein